MREEGDLARPEAEAGDVEQVEILQRIGADEILGLLARLVALARHQLGRDLGGEDVEHRGRSLRTEALGLATQRIRCWISVFETEPLTL
jgi:hypothetical protein